MMRVDLYVDNESGGLMIASDRIARGFKESFSDEQRAWKKAREAGQAWILDAEEMPFVVRVLMGEAPTESELAAVVESFEGGLHVPDGRLDLMGGILVGEEVDEAENGQVFTIDVPPSWYRARFSVLIGSPHAPYELDGEDLEAFWMRTRSKRLPAWLRDPDEMEDHLVDFLLTLTPIEGPESGPPGGPYLQWGSHVLKSERCPDPLFAENLQGLIEPETFVQTGLIYTHAIPDLLEDLTPVPLDRPVDIPISELVLPYWIAWITGETHPLVEVSNCEEWTCAWPGFLRGVQETKTETGWRVDIEGSNARWSQFGHLRQISGLLSSLPDGATLELSCASDESEDGMGFHRYRGPVRNGIWSIEETCPALMANELLAMLEIVREAETGLTFQLRDQAEGERILDACRTKDYLLCESPPTLRKGTISLPKKNGHLVAFLAARVFIERFHGVIPMMDRDDDVDEWDSMMEEIAEAGAKWATGETVADGAFARFTRGDLTSIAPELPVEVKQYEEDLRGLGFEVLGDLNSTQTFAACFRGYGYAGSVVYAALITNGIWSLSFDFYTAFESGWSLTTSRAESLSRQTEKRIKVHRIEHPGSTSERFLAHLARVAEIEAAGDRPKRAEPELTAFALALDEFMKRTVR